MSNLPAVVTILDLTLATTLSSAALFEAVQTTNSAVESVGVSLAQIMTTGFGALPTNGATGAVLGKSSGGNFDAAWTSVLGLASLTVTGALSAFSAAAIPAAGSSTLGIKISSAVNFGVFFGSGVPTLSAATGSLYLRSDGTTATTRLYVATNGAGTWTGVTTFG